MTYILTAVIKIDYQKNQGCGKMFSSKLNPKINAIREKLESYELGVGESAIRAVDVFNLDDIKIDRHGNVSMGLTTQARQKIDIVHSAASLLSSSGVTYNMPRISCDTRHISIPPNDIKMDSPAPDELVARLRTAMRVADPSIIDIQSLRYNERGDMLFSTHQKIDRYSLAALFEKVGVAHPPHNVAECLQHHKGRIPNELITDRFSISQKNKKWSWVEAVDVASEPNERVPS